MDGAVTAAKCKPKFGLVRDGRGFLRAESRGKVDGCGPRCRVEKSAPEEVANVAVEIGSVGVGLT